MSNNEEQSRKIELHDLQPILSRTFGDQLIVVRYTTKDLLQPGENYGSTILSVHAVIKRDNEAKEEDLHLIAKMPPPTEFQRQMFDSPYTFKKEIFMYENIVPYYRDLEREVGLKEDELFDILPKYYQSRLSLSPDIDFDDNAVILMENLKVRGYYTNNRVTGSVTSFILKKTCQSYKEILTYVLCLSQEFLNWKEIISHVINKLFDSKTVECQLSATDTTKIKLITNIDFIS